MMTIQEVISNQLLCKGDAVRYTFELEKRGFDVLSWLDTGERNSQVFYAPYDIRWYVKEIYPDGSIDLDASETVFNISLSGTIGFANAEVILQKVSEWFENRELHTYARPYSIEDLKRDSHSYVPSPEVKLVFYPGGTGRRGITSEQDFLGEEAYRKTYLTNKERRFYYFDEGGILREDENGITYAIASKNHPVFVTGSQKMFARINDDIHFNYWIPEKGILFGTDKMMEYVCYIDKNGFLQYDFMLGNNAIYTHRLRPIVHVLPNTPVEDLYVGKQTGRRICKL